MLICISAFWVIDLATGKYLVYIEQVFERERKIERAIQSAVINFLNVLNLTKVYLCFVLVFPDFHFTKIR